MTEDWRPTPYPGYEVSSEGRVRSRRGVLALSINDQGYPVASMRVGGRNLKRRAHRLVADAFLGASNGREVRHKSGVKADCRLINLEYGSHAENQMDRIGHGTWGWRLTADQVRQIRHLAGLGIPQGVIAQNYGTSQTNVGRIVRGETWKHLLPSANVAAA